MPKIITDLLIFECRLNRLFYQKFLGKLGIQNRRKDQTASCQGYVDTTENQNNIAFNTRLAKVLLVKDILKDQMNEP
jgi:hypothetical protein